MKIQNLLFAVILSFILALTLVSAININYTVYNATIEDNGAQTNTTTPVTNFNVITYNCTSLNCLTIGAVISSSTSFLNSNVVKIAFPVTLSSSYGYVSYFYKEEYIGWAQKSNWAGSGENQSTRSIYLLKKRSGSANITNFNVNNSTGVISAVIDSAIKNTSFASIPLLERVNTTVNLVIANASGLVYSQSQNVMIAYSASQPVNFNYNFSQLASGNYTVNLSTDVLNEKKILTSIPRSNSMILAVFNNNSINNVSNGTIPVITITNPINGNNYTNASTLTLNGTSTQSVSWNYTLNGNFTNAGFGSVINLPLNATNLINGTNVLVIFADNLNGTVNQTIIFNYNGTIIPVIPVVPLATIAILSPNQNNYNVTQLTINLSSTNSQAVWYNWNGTNQIYIAPSVTNFRNNGTYTLFAYANNSIGNITSANFTFVINTSLSDTTAPIITNITTIPNITNGSNYTNNGTTQNLTVNFTSNEYPINVTFNLYNITSLVNTSGPFTLQNASGLPLTYVIPNNLSNGVYFLNMTVSDSLGNTATYVVGNFTVLRPVSNVNNNTNNTINDDDDEDSDSDHNDGEILHFGTNSDYSIADSNNTMGLIDLTSNKDSLTLSQWILYWLFLLILILLLILVLILIFRRISQ